MAKYFDSYFAPTTSYFDSYFGPAGGGIIPTALSSYGFSLLVASLTYQSSLSGSTYISSLSLAPVYQSSLQ